MGVQEIVEILLTFFQYFALTNAVDVEFPSVWSVPTDWLNWAALNLKLDIPWLPRTDFRGHFLMITVGLPLLLAVLMLIIFKSFLVAIWYCMLLFSITLLGTGALAKFLPSSGLTRIAPADFLLILGGSLLAFCLLALAVNIFAARRRRQRIASGQVEIGEEEAEYERQVRELQKQILQDSAMIQPTVGGDHLAFQYHSHALQIPAYVPNGGAYSGGKSTPNGEGQVMQNLYPGMHHLGYPQLPIPQNSYPHSMHLGQPPPSSTPGGAPTLSWDTTVTLPQAVPSTQNSGHPNTDHHQQQGHLEDHTHLSSTQQQENLLRLRQMEQRRRRNRSRRMPSVVSSRSSASGDSDDHAQDGPREEDLNVETLTHASLRSSLQRVRKRNPCLLVRDFIVGVGLLVCGLFASKILKPEWFGLSRDDNFVDAVGLYFGYVMIGASGFIFMIFFLSLCDCGRHFLFKTRIFLKAHFIKVLLFLTIIMYVPIINAVLTVFNCSDRSCPSGTQFVDRTVRLSEALSSFVAVEGMCKNCTFSSSTCPVSDICPGENGFRLDSDPTLSCSDEILPYYAPGAGLSFLAYVVGIPLLYLILIQVSTKYIQQIEVQSTDPNQSLSVADKWNVQTAVTRSSAKILYFSFQHKWRYYKLIQIVQKIILVGTAIFLYDYPRYASAIMTGVHLFFFGVFLFSRPYIASSLNLLSGVTSFCNVSNAAVALVLSWNVTIPNVALIVLLSMNAAFPAIALVAGLFMSRRRVTTERRKFEKTKKELEQKKREEETKRKQSIAEAAAAIGQSWEEDEEGTLEKEHDMEAKRQKNREENQALAIELVVDRQLNERILRYMVNFFLLVGVVSFLILGVAFVGVVIASSKDDFIPIDPDRSNTCTTNLRDFEFARYGSWSDFTSNCCCAEGTSGSRFQKVEFWTCRNGVRKERPRVENGDESGLTIRGFCAPDFNPGICATSPSCDSNQGGYYVSVCNANLLNNPQPTERALDFLW